VKGMKYLFDTLVYVLEVKKKYGTVTDYLSASSFMIVFSEYHQKQMIEHDTRLFRYSDFRSIQGVAYPMHERYVDDISDSELRKQSIKLNTGVRDDLFITPVKPEFQVQWDQNGY
jgi:hypothetical protein